jgi:hypothetical protein
MKEARHIHRALVMKTSEKWPLGKLRSQENIKMDLCEDLIWTELPQYHVW